MNIQIIKDDTGLREILRRAETIALVGASPDPERDSNRIMEYLLKAGYDVVPVNPKYEEVLGIRCYPTVEAIGRHIDIVDVFRRSEFLTDVSKDAVKSRASVLWMQLGIFNEEAAKEAVDKGIKVVMNRCIMVEYRRLLPEGKSSSQQKR